MDTRLAVAVTILMVPAAASAQLPAITGVVIEAESGAPVAGADVVLLDDRDVVLSRTMSGDQGYFRLTAERAGTYRLRAARIGFHDVATERFTLVAGASAFVELTMTVRPVVAEPLDVRATALKPHLVRSGFYQRQTSGFGHYITADDIDARSADRVTDLLRNIPGVRVLRARDSWDVLMPGATTMFLRSSAGGNRTCYPSIAIDGVLVRRGGQDGEVGAWNQLVHPNDVEAVEVYARAAGLPARMAGPVSPCGGILIWTRQSG